jgi:hypothetical protein
MWTIPTATGVHGSRSNLGEAMPRPAVPSARYAQWRAVLHAGNTKPAVDSVTLNYLPKNVAPEIDDVTVQIGVRYQSTCRRSPAAALGVGSPADRQVDISTHPCPARMITTPSALSGMLMMKTTISWCIPSTTAATARSRWLLLKDNLSEKAYSCDASLLPDGGYTVKVVASDAPSHSPGEALRAERESRRFEVDTTPPRIENLAASDRGRADSRDVPRGRWIFFHQARRILGGRGRVEVRRASRPTFRR